jgi:RNA polymerase sigma factor (sigma-70 family)
LVTDQQLLRAFKAKPSVEAFQPLLDRYLPFVLATAQRQLGNAADAQEATRAVFMALARRMRRLPRRTVLAGWLFEATQLAVRKLKRIRKSQPAPAPVTAKPNLVVTGNDTWARISPLLDPALARLSPKYRNVVLLHYLLNWNTEDAGQGLRLKPKRLEKRAVKGLRKLLKQLRKKRLLIEGDTLTTALAAQRIAAVPNELVAILPKDCAECFHRRPQLPLARRTLRALAWAPCKRRLKQFAWIAGALAVLAGTLAGSIILLWRSGWLLPMLILIATHFQVKHVPELAQPARPWSAEPGRQLDAATATSGAEFYRGTNIWQAHLTFSAEQWKALRPSRVRPVSDIMQPNGTIVLRNPRARRNGVAGVLGFDFNWAHADLELSGRTLTNVAARLRGNGTYLTSLWGPKQSYKVDVDKFEKPRELAGVHTLDFLNLVEDRSYLSDTLGYELFRSAGVPAPRTAFAWLTVTAAGQWDHKPLGLYLLVENVDADFAADRFGSRRVPIFKPVTPDLFKDLGDDWSAYARIYDLKTKATDAQKHRVIEFARLVSHANDMDFAQRLPEFLDLDEFARFMAALVLVANYDSLLTYGQNYYLYLDPHTDRFGFIPWDLDQAWGSFPQFGTSMGRERASIWHPWTMQNRFLQRVFVVEQFRQLYRQRLDDLLATAFRPEQLYARVDELAPVIRGPIAAESAFRLRLFDQAVSTNWLTGPRDSGGDDQSRPVHQIKRFIVNRAKSVRAQLDGKSKGIVLEPVEWGQ